MKTKFSKAYNKFQVISDDNRVLEEFTVRREARECMFRLKREARKAEQDRQRIEQEKNQTPVKSIVITIEWKKSRMWGSNPHCEAEVCYKENPQGKNYERSPVYTASGCGYDKESTVIAEVFNAYLKYKLYEKIELLQTKQVDANGQREPKYPYGLNEWEGKCYYAGGIGTSCYYRIAEFIGGKFEHVSSGKTFDVYKYTDNN